MNRGKKQSTAETEDFIDHCSRKQTEPPEWVLFEYTTNVCVGVA